MAESTNDALTPEELAEQGSEQLPEREEMALVNANVAIPINAAVAAQGHTPIDWKIPNLG